MEQSPKHARTPQAGAGEAHGRALEKAKNRKPLRKISRQKSVRVVHGAPEIAHPDGGERYECQLELIYAWFFEMWDRVASGDEPKAVGRRRREKAAHEARSELQTLLLNATGRLLWMALQKKDSAMKRWSGELLASIGQSVWKHHKKLSKANKAYENESKKIGKLRGDLLFPKSRVTRAVKHELKKAKRYRETLLLLKEGLRDGDRYAVRVVRRRIWLWLDRSGETSTHS